MQITMTLLVRNEDDILRDNIIYHHAQGIDRFIVMDNLSTDGTKQIIEDLSGYIDIDYIYQTDDTYDQSVWVTEMARRAANAGADWVINNDADEFWQTATGSIRDYLGTVPAEISKLYVDRHNAVLLRQPQQFTGVVAHPASSRYFEVVSKSALGTTLPPKCAHRASATISVTQGNHDATGLPGQGTVAGNALRILHFPYRSFARYRDKIRHGGSAYNRNTHLTENIGATWRRHYRIVDDPEFQGFWRDLHRTRQETIVASFEGEVFEDVRLLEFLSGSRTADRQRRLTDAAGKLLADSTTLINEFCRETASYILEAPREDRHNRPFFYNLEFSLNGAKHQLSRLTALLSQPDGTDLRQTLPQLRDIFSLFPRNNHIIDFIRALFEIYHEDDLRKLQADCKDTPVVMHISCQKYVAKARASAESFVSKGDRSRHIIVVGETRTVGEDETGLTFGYHDGVLSIPVSDFYESLHRKVFYALLVLRLAGRAETVVKIDDDLHLADKPVFDALVSRVTQDDSIFYAGRMVGADYHFSQWHGWHVGKSADKVIDGRGYQYPLPRRYAAGGYGYFVKAKGLDACCYMYLAMKEFFAMQAVGLEDACIGHAMYAQGIDVVDVSTADRLLALPGLQFYEIDMMQSRPKP